MSISNFSLEFFNAPIIEVTPMASVVQDAKISAGLLGSGSGTLSLGERDRSSSSPGRSIGDLLPSSWWGRAWSPCSDPAADPDSIFAPCPGTAGFSVGGTSLGMDVFAIKLSRRRVRAWCTRCERPGPRYSLGMLRSNSTHHKKTRIHLSLSLTHPKVRASHLNRWFTLPIKITLTITPRCVPHILTGNVWSFTLRCLRQKRDSADRWQHAKLTHTPLSMHAQLFTYLQNRSQWFLRIKPIDMSCRKNENSAKLMTADIKKLFKLGLTSPNSVQSEIVQNSDVFKIDNERANKNFQDISKLQIHSSLSSTALCTAFLCPFCNWWSSLPELSVATQLANESKISNVAIYDTCPFKQFSWLPIQTCTGGCRSRRIPEPSWFLASDIR